MIGTKIVKFDFNYYRKEEEENNEMISKIDLQSSGRRSGVSIPGKAAATRRNN